MPSVNWLDLILIILLAVGMAVGYRQGLLREVIGLAAMYLGAILAAQYFQPLANTFKNLFPTTPGTLLNVIAFFIILFSAMGLVNFLAYDAYKMTHLRILPTLDHFGGLLVGLVSTWVLLTIAINVIGFSTANQGWAGAETFRIMLKQGITSSQLADATASTLPTILSALKPWLPTGLPAIFNS